MEKAYRRIDAEPPAPYVDAIVQSGHANPKTVHGVAALLDTGSPYTLVPESMLAAEALRSREFRPLTTPMGPSGPVVVQVRIVRAAVEFCGRPPSEMTVGVWKGGYVIVGRDLLNALEIRLDGRTISIADCEGGLTSGQ